MGDHQDIGASSRSETKSFGGESLPPVSTSIASADFGDSDRIRRLWNADKTPIDATMFYGIYTSQFAGIADRQFVVIWFESPDSTNSNPVPLNNLVHRVKLSSYFERSLVSDTRFKALELHDFASVCSPQLLNTLVSNSAWVICLNDNISKSLELRHVFLNFIDALTDEQNTNKGDSVRPSKTQDALSKEQVCKYHASTIICNLDALITSSINKTSQICEEVSGVLGEATEAKSIASSNELVDTLSDRFLLYIDSCFRLKASGYTVTNAYNRNEGDEIKAKPIYSNDTEGVKDRDGFEINLQVMKREYLEAPIEERNQRLNPHVSLIASDIFTHLLNGLINRYDYRNICNPEMRYSILNSIEKTLNFVIPEYLFKFVPNSRKK